MSSVNNISINSLRFFIRSIMDNRINIELTTTLKNTMFKALEGDSMFLKSFGNENMIFKF